MHLFHSMLNFKNYDVTCCYILDVSLLNAYLLQLVVLVSSYLDLPADLLEDLPIEL